MNQVRYTCLVDVMQNNQKVHGLKVYVFNNEISMTNDEIEDAAFSRARDLLSHCKFSNQEFNFLLREWYQVSQRAIV